MMKLFFPNCLVGLYFKRHALAHMRQFTSVCVSWLFWSGVILVLLNLFFQCIEFDSTTHLPTVNFFFAKPTRTDHKLCLLLLLLVKMPLRRHRWTHLELFQTLPMVKSMRMRNYVPLGLTVGWLLKAHPLTVTMYGNLV